MLLVIIIKLKENFQGCICKEVNTITYNILTRWKHPRFQEYDHSANKIIAFNPHEKSAPQNKGTLNPTFPVI